MSTPPDPDPVVPDWYEDPDLAVAVAEVADFVGSAGWDQPPQLFALVSAAVLSATGLQVEGDAVFTALAQEPLPVDPATGDVAVALAGISWPAEVTGCVLSQEIVVLPPDAVAGGEVSAEQAAAHPDRTEARLTAAVLRGRPGGACLLQVRSPDDTPPLRGADLAPNLLRALQATFLD